MNYRIYTLLFILIAASAAIAELYIGYFYQTPREIHARQDSINRLYMDHEFWCQHSDGIILGSSRTRSLLDVDVHGLKLYSLAADGMYPDEYHRYIEFYKQSCQKPAKHILIGMDFFAANGQRLGRAESPDFFIEKAAKPLNYLLTFDHFAIRLLNLALGHGSWGYRHSYRPLRTTLKEPLAKSDDYLLPKVPAVYEQNRWYNLLYGNFLYDKELIEHYRKIKTDNSAADIRVWLTPVSKQLFSQMVKFGLVEEYKQFIRDAVTVFGRLDNFMWINDVTAASENFVDVAHIRYDMLDFMVASVLDRCDCKDLPKFDEILTADNLDTFFKQLDQFVEQYQHPGDSVDIVSLGKSGIGKTINAGDYLDINLPAAGSGLEKNMQLCIRGKSDFAVLQFDKQNRVHSKVYQRRKNCQFDLNLLETTVRLRLIPIYDYPLSVESLTVIRSL